MSKRDRCESTIGPSGGIRCDKRRGHEGSHGALNGPDWVDHEFSADAMRHENALLLAQVATLTAERDRLRASNEGIAASLEAQVEAARCHHGFGSLASCGCDEAVAWRKAKGLKES